MNETINIKIITPVNIVFEAKAKMVTMPGEEGIFGVLPNHAPLIASLKPGLVKISINNLSGQDTIYFIYKGMAEVTGIEVNIVTEFAINVTKLSQVEISEEIANLKNNINNETNTTKINIIKTDLIKYESLLTCLKDN
ncbi:F0F1 ATP synthase subunit epsilon [Rickettsia endosymbiont of Orchestes rusci]|uniref:F0F1 ATP synthase subunit epsilon n=1 Tax=Rickettsia endosymbiont of Orchestes rusci TaxID=3066250 RepID=UPI0020A18491|nr:F0F1 ATP synthase subunit epsilon [Rickettsia endosymbiont of Ceutorhynchus assimilis]